MSAQTSIVVPSGQSYLTGRVSYLSEGFLSQQEKEEFPQGREFFSRLKNQLSEKQARKQLENKSENELVSEIIFSTKQYKRLGETNAEHRVALKSAVRETLADVFKEMEHPNVPWAGAIHEDTDHEHAHVLVARQYVDEKTGEIKNFPQYLPKHLFELENGTTKLSNRFQQNLDKRLKQFDALEITLPTIDQPLINSATTHEAGGRKGYDNYYPTARLTINQSDLNGANKTEQPAAKPTELTQIPTLPADPDVLDGTRALLIREQRQRREFEKLRREAETVSEKKSALENQTTQINNQPIETDRKKPADDDFKKETRELNEIPVERVFAQWGLYKSPKLGKNTWISGDGEHKINVLSGNKFADVAAGKSKKDDNYLSSVSRVSAINAAIYMSDGAMSFIEARTWVKDTFGSGTRSKKKTTVENIPAPENESSDSATQTSGHAETKKIGEFQKSRDQAVPLSIPDFEPKKQKQIIDYLINQRGISSETVQAATNNGSLAANDKGSAVFVLRDFAGKTTGYSLRSTWSGFRQNTDGTSKDLGTFYLGSPEAAKEITLVEAPIEALSYYDLNKHQDWKDKAVVSLGGASLGTELFEQLKASPSLEKVTVALNSDEPGQRAARKIAHQFTDQAPHVQVENLIPAAEEDWNDYLKAVKAQQSNQTTIKPASSLEKFTEYRRSDPTAEPDFYQKLIAAEAAYRQEALKAAKHQQSQLTAAETSVPEQPVTTGMDGEVKLKQGEEQMNQTKFSQSATLGADEPALAASKYNGQSLTLLHQTQTLKKPLTQINDQENLSTTGLAAAGDEFIKTDLNRLIQTTSDRLTQKHANFNELASSPEYFIAKPVLQQIYQVKADPILVEELQQGILRGESAKFGLNPSEAINFGERWINSLAAKNPNLNDRQFKEQTDDSRQRREEVYGRIAAARIQGELKRRGLAQSPASATSPKNDRLGMVDGFQERNFSGEADRALQRREINSHAASFVHQPTLGDFNPAPSIINNDNAVHVSIVKVDDLRSEWQRRDGEQHQQDREEWHSLLTGQQAVSLSAGDSDHTSETTDLWHRREAEIKDRDEKSLRQTLEKLRIHTDQAQAEIVMGVAARQIPARLAQSEVSKPIDNLHQSGLPRTWVSAEGDEAANVYLLTANNSPEQSLSLVERETRLRKFKGSRSELGAFAEQEKLLPVTAAFAVEEIKSGATSVHLLVNQTSRTALFAGSEETVHKFAGANLIKHVDAKNQIVYLAVDPEQRRLILERAAETSRLAEPTSVRSVEQTAEQLNEHEPQVAFNKLAAVVSQIEIKNTPAESEARNLTWVQSSGKQFTESAGLTDLRSRLSRLAEHQTVEPAERVINWQQQQLDLSLRLRPETIKNLFAEKQYLVETNQLSDVLTNSVSDNSDSSVKPQSAANRRDEILAKIEAARESISPSALLAEQTVELKREVKEFAFATRDQKTYLAVDSIGDPLIKSVNYDTGRTLVHAHTLAAEAAQAASRAEDFNLRGKNERFIITGGNDQIFSRREFDASTERNASAPVTGQTPDPNMHGWSLRDAAETQATLRKEVEMLSFVHDHQQKDLQEIKAGYNETIKNMFLPDLNLQGRLQPLTDFEHWIKSSLDPVARLKAHPVVRLVEAWSERSDADQRLAATKEQLDSTQAKLEKVETIIQPIVAEKYDERGETLRREAIERAEFARKVKEQAEVKQAGLTEPVKSAWTQAELEKYGEQAALAGSVEHLEFYRREKLRTLGEKKWFELQLDQIIKPAEFKEAGVIRDEKLTEHIFELSNAPASSDGLNKLRLKGEETAGHNALTTEITVARAEGKLAEWLKNQAAQSAERIEPNTRQELAERLAGKGELLKARKEELALWHDREFEVREEKKNINEAGEKAKIKFGKAFTEPVKIKDESGGVTTVTVKNLLKDTRDDDYLRETVKQANETIIERRDLSNGQIAGLDVAEAATKRMIAETSSSLGIGTTATERKLLTQIEASTLATSLANNPQVVGAKTTTRQQNETGSSFKEIAGRMSEVVTDNPVRAQDTVIFEAKVQQPEQNERIAEEPKTTALATETIKLNHELAQTVHTAPARRARTRAL